MIAPGVSGDLLDEPQFSRRWLLRTAGGAAAFASTRRVRAMLGPLGQGAPPTPANVIVRSSYPQDFETPLGQLTSWITPNDAFFVRSHLPAPRIEPDSWALTVDGRVDRPLTLRAADLQTLPQVTAVITLECAGNGRAFFDPPVPGIQWRKGAVGTARWTGVRLSDVLNRAGVQRGARFVALDGADRPPGKVPDFVRTMPMSKALHPATLLATHMNGEPLPMAHGFPLRAIVAGWEAAYSVKWLTHIQVLENDHDGFFVQTAYRYPTSIVQPGATVDPRDTVALTDLAVKSILTAPVDGARIREGRVRVAGFAWAGEADVVRVDISTDGGTTWVPARLDAGTGAQYAWRPFHHDWTVTRAGAFEVLSRATDSRGRTQPRVGQWNPSGYLWNAVDRVHVATGSIERADESADPPDSRLPPGPAADEARRTCAVCHDTRMMTAQRLNDVGWTREVDKMVRWGADLSASERDRLIAYFAEHFPPR